MKSKPFKISKRAVYEAYKKVKRNRGSAGIDDVSFDRFEENLGDNLYRVWNRMSSGSYFPQPVKAVQIPKKAGGHRTLGIPTIEDRIAQMVAKSHFEPIVNPIFHNDSYGYRPAKSALDAVGQARKRCWKYDFVIELDIKGLFDNISHNLLMKAVRKHTDTPWLILYITRWLETPFMNVDGTLTERTSGTPQGGVISPVLANLFMHYALDVWLSRAFPNAPFERYADDAIIHCNSESEAQAILKALKNRMSECQLELHPTKTKIVYCQDKERQAEFPCTSFEFLGYEFRKRFIKDRRGRLQFNFLPAVSKASEKSLRQKIKEMKLHKRSGSMIETIAERVNPVVRGWLNYFMKYSPSSVSYTMNCLNQRLVKWVMHKYKPFRGRRRKAENWLKEIAQREPNLFSHWALGWKP